MTRNGLISAEMVAALNALQAVNVGDRVTVTDGGQTYEMTVTVAARRSDGSYGSAESTYVTASFGPGRYSLDVRAERVARGTQSIVRVQS